MILDERKATVCPLQLKESEMTADECITLDVYAEQYGVRSENKTYTVCYYSKLKLSGKRYVKICVLSANFQISPITTEFGAYYLAGSTVR